MAEQSPQAIRIFLSHSNKDDDFGVKLVEDLRRALGDEAAVWFDSLGGLHGGDNWWRKIIEELNTRNIFIVVISPNSMQSPWVNDEIDMAWRLKNSPARMRIIPVLYRPCEVRTDLGDLQIISFLPPKSYESAFKEMLIALGLTADVAISRTAPAQTTNPAPNSSPGSVLLFDGKEGKTVPVRSPGFFKGKILLLLSLALLVIVASVGFSLALFHQKEVGVGTTPTATAKITTTATISQVSTDTTTSSLIPTGVVVLDDPMRDASRGYQWDQLDVAGTGHCGFTNNAYHVTSLQPLGIVSCSPEAKVPSLSNLTFEVQVVIVSGDEGGVTFRGNSGSLQFYYFAVASDGSYHLDIVNGSLNLPQQLLQGTNAAIKKGPNQPNMLAVVANGASISVYVNNSFIGKVNDSTYSQGQIGVAAGDTGDPTEAVFSAATVWN